MSISSDEINFLIYRYLQENGFSHTAFAFAHESLVVRSSVSQVELPAGALITFLQKGLEYVGIEEHINEDGSVREFDGNYSLLSPFICEAIGVKEERRYRSKHQQPDGQQSGGANPSADVQVKQENGSSLMEVSEPPAASTSISTDLGYKSLEFKSHDAKEVYTCSWNPSTQQLATGSADGTCRLWGMGTVKWDVAPDDEFPVMMSVLPHYREEGELYKEITSIQWAPNGAVLATGCYDGAVRLWNSEGTLKAILNKHEGPVFALKWSKDGKYLLTGGNDKKAVIWDPLTQAVVKSYFLHSAPILDVDWGEGDVFATSSSDRVIHVCQVSVHGNAAQVTFIGHSSEINSISFSPDGRRLASSSDDATAKIWSVDKGLVHDLRGHVKEVFSSSWASIGNDENSLTMLCTASFDGTVKVWSADSGTLIHNLKRSMQPCYCLSSSPNGELLAVGSLKGYVSVWNLKDGSLVREFKESGDTFCVAWNSDGSMLCSCFSKGTIKVMLTEDIVLKA